MGTAWRSASEYSGLTGLKPCTERCRSLSTNGDIPFWTVGKSSQWLALMLILYVDYAKC